MNTWLYPIHFSLHLPSISPAHHSLISNSFFYVPRLKDHQWTGVRKEGKECCEMPTCGCSRAIRSLRSSSGGCGRAITPCIHSSSGGLHMVKSVQVQLSKKRPVLPGRGVASECAAGHRPRWGQGVWSSWTFTKSLPASPTFVHCWPFLYIFYSFH